MRRNVIFLIPGMTLCGFCFLLPFSSWGQSTLDPAEQIQQLSLQSEKLMTEYSKKKQEIEDTLRQRLSSLTKSPGDRARRKKMMEEANQKILELQEKFKLDMDSIHEAQANLLHSSSGNQGSQSKKKGFSKEELQEKIRAQDALLLEEKMSSVEKPQLPTQPGNVNVGEKVKEVLSVEKIEAAIEQVNESLKKKKKDFNYQY